MANSRLYFRGYDSRPLRAEWAKAAADSALKRQPDLPDARMALGWYYSSVRRDYPLALDEFTRAYQGQPYNSQLLMAMAGVERRLGRYREAAAHLRRAVLLDPRSGTPAMLLGLVLCFLRDYEEADHYFTRAIALQPDWALPYAARAQMYVAWKGDTAGARAILRNATGRVSLADILGHLGYAIDIGFAVFLATQDSALDARVARLTPADFSRLPYGTPGYFLTRAHLAWARGNHAAEHSYSDSARVLLEPMPHPAEEDLIDVWLGLARAGLGDSAGAMKAVANAIAIRPVESDQAYGAERAIVFAQIYLRIGDRERAVTELERLVGEPSPLSIRAIAVDPTWKALRGNPRFERLLGVGLDQP